MSFGGKIKRNIADKHFSDCIRKAAEWKCQRCEKDYTDRPQGLQCSHFIGRGITMHGTHGYATRFDPLNCLSLCSACHGYVEAHPVAHINLWRDVYGSIYGADKSDAALNALLQRSECKSRAQYAKNNRLAISAHYLNESRRLDEEIEKYHQGKEADYEVYSYTQRAKTLHHS